MVREFIQDRDNKEMMNQKVRMVIWLDFNGLKTEIMNDKVKELIELYEAILHGKKEKMGLFDCSDSYYAGCWDEQLKEVENLKQELVKN